VNKIWNVVIERFNACESMLEDTGKHLISTKTIREQTLARLDLGGINEESEYLIDIGLTQVIQGVLFYHGYRSVGRGYFINLEKCNDPVYLQRLYNRAETSAEAKEAIRIKIEVLKVKYTNPQLVFGGIECKIREPMTEAEFEEMIREDAV
jgi:hypothetical protein